MISRRGFLKGPGALAALAPGRANTTPAGDDFRIGPVRFEWRGWKEPAAQLVTYGVWTARHDDVTDGFIYATTLGSVDVAYSDLATLSLVRQRGWPVITSPSSPVAEPVKRRALQRLMIAIQTGEIPWPTNP